MKSYLDFYANGRFRRSSGAQRAVIVNPYTEQPIGEVRLCAPEDLDIALICAQRAQASWSATSRAERQAALRCLASEIESRSDAIVSCLAEEIGCPVWLGRMMQVPMALKDIQFAVEGIEQIAWNETIGNAVVERVPVGLVAAITPWNFPLHQIAAKVVGAVAAGCAVVLKPSEIAPGAAVHFMEAVHAAGLPPGLVNLVWGGAELGAALVADPRVDQISFTGSTVVGRLVMEAASKRLARVTLELGGKSAALILEDADLGAALPAVVRLSMANSGQACVSQSRLIVPRELLPQVEQELVELTKQWPLGDPQDDATRLGPVATASQFAQVGRMIARAVDQGATLLCGAANRPDSLARGYFIAPTIFSNVRPDMDIAQEEVFGPVLAVIPSDSEEHGVRIANSTAYGLSGAVWSRSLERAGTVAQQMRTGQVVLNGAPQNLATPFGGWGQSGFGRENGRFGIEECLQYRSLHGLVTT